MAERPRPASIDDYISGFPPETQSVLQDVRALIRQAAPDATETISYGIPTFDLRGSHLVFFAGYPRHLGFYPVTATVSEAFATELAPFKRGKGSVQFPLDRPIPLDLIRRMVEYRAREVTTRD